MAFANLSANAVRSFLSILGVVIGIASVITILSVGAGAKKQILKQIDSLGGNMYYLSSQYDEEKGRMGEFELTDIDRVEALPSVINATPQINLYKTLRSRATENHGVVNGVTASFLAAQEYAILRGNNFSPIEIEERKLVCLINENAARVLFPELDPVGRTLFVEGTPWTVIGVYGPLDKEMRKLSRDINDLQVAAPLQALIRSAKDVRISNLEIRVKPNAGPEVAQEILNVMVKDDPERKNLFQVRDLKDYYQRSLDIQRMMSLIGVIVAGISLLVGGIGMMNVMLTSVAERTREIGLRRAVGARRKDILFQFLVESCVLSSAGGLLGLIMGAAVARVLPRFFANLSSMLPQLQPSFLVLAVGAGIILGVGFGFYPAVKASKLSPAEALRSE